MHVGGEKLYNIIHIYLFFLKCTGLSKATHSNNVNICLYNFRELKNKMASYLAHAQQYNAAAMLNVDPSKLQIF